MTDGTRWKTFPACGAPMFPSLLRKKHPIEKQTHKGEIQEWENEGGNVVAAALPPYARCNTGPR